MAWRCLRKPRSHPKLIECDVGIAADDRASREIHTLTHQVAAHPPFLALNRVASNKSSIVWSINMQVPADRSIVRRACLGLPPSHTSRRCCPPVQSAAWHDEGEFKPDRNFPDCERRP